MTRLNQTCLCIVAQRTRRIAETQTPVPHAVDRPPGANLTVELPATIFNRSDNHACPLADQTTRLEVVTRKLIQCDVDHWGAGVVLLRGKLKHKAYPASAHLSCFFSLRPRNNHGNSRKTPTRGLNIVIPSEPTPEPR